MRVSDELFELIKSLSVGENRVVLGALSARKTELYRIYQGLQSHDHDAIKAMFSHNSTQHIASTKRQLYEDILEALWRGGLRNAQRRLHDYHGACELLMRKGLYDLALRRANLLIEESRRFEAIQELLVGLEMKRRILEITPIADEHDGRDRAWAQLVVDGLAERGRVEQAYSLAMAARRAPLATRDEAIAQAWEAMPPAESLKLGRSRIRRHRAAYILHRLRGAHDACAQACAAVLEVLADQPDLLEDTTLRDEYFTNLHFQIVYDTTCGRFKDAEKGLKKFELACKKWIGGISGDQILFSRIMVSRLVLGLYQKQYEHVKATLKGILLEAKLQSNSLIFNQKPRWLRVAFQAMFMMKDYRSIRFLAFKLKESIPHTHQEHEFYACVAMFQLFSMLEENDEDIQQAASSTNSWLTSIGCGGPYVNLMLGYVEKLSKGSCNFPPLALLDEFEKDLNAMFENPLTWQFRETFPILKWIKSKREKVEIKSLMFQLD